MTNYQDISMGPVDRTYRHMLTGSTRVHSGLPFLYSANGTTSMVLEATMVDRVDGGVLQHAVDQTLRRYPYFTSSFERRGDQYFVADNPCPVLVARTPFLRPLGGGEVNGHLIDITYWDHTIWVSYHHGLTDGRGIMQFFQHLVNAYVSGDVSGDERLAGPEPAKAAEMREPMELTENGPDAHEQRDVGDTADESGESQPVHHLFAESSGAGGDPSFRYSFSISEADFVEFAHARNASPAIAAAVLVARAAQEETGQDTGVDTPRIVVNMASDLRGGADNPDSLRNSVGSISLPIAQPVGTDAEFTAAATDLREAIREQKRPENMRRALEGMAGLYRKLDELPNLEAKQQLVGALDELVDSSFVLSYSGRVELGAAESHVRELHTYRGGTSGLTVQMMAANGTIGLDLIQDSEDPRYASLLSDELREGGVEHSVSGAIRFTTPVDELGASGGCAERAAA